MDASIESIPAVVVKMTVDEATSLVAKMRELVSTYETFVDCGTLQPASDFIDVVESQLDQLGEG